jgi:hypothetical protein
MDSKTTLVTSVEQLLEATQDERMEQIILRGEIQMSPRFVSHQASAWLGRRMGRHCSFV